MRIIGMDIHRVIAEVVALEDGAIERLGRIGMTPNQLEDFARTLLPTRWCKLTAVDFDAIMELSISKYGSLTFDVRWNLGEPVQRRAGWRLR